MRSKAERKEREKGGGSHVQVKEHEVQHEENEEDALKGEDGNERHAEALVAVNIGGLFLAVAPLAAGRLDRPLPLGWGLGGRAEPELVVQRECQEEGDDRVGDQRRVIEACVDVRVHVSNQVHPVSNRIKDSSREGGGPRK